MEIIAHRGTPRELPENSVPGFLRALDQGADAIELDTHATRDNVAIVHHDFAPRVSVGAHAPRIKELTRSELSGYPLAPGIAIPTLADVLTAIADRATVYVEIKATGIEEIVVATIRSHGARCAVHSFDHRIVRLVRSLAPELTTGLLLASYVLDLPSMIRDSGAGDVWEQWEHIDADLVRDAHAAGARVIAWTVNDADEAMRLVDLGVDGICTDLPAMMRHALRDS